MSQFKSHMRQSWFQSLILIVLATLLFWEWLKPLPELTDTSTIMPFVYTFFLVLLVKSFRFHLLLEISIIALAIAYYYHHLFIGGPFFDKNWLIFIRGEMMYSLQLLMEKNFIEHSPFIRTLGFFVMVWLLAVSIYHNMMDKRRILLFFLCTIIYLAIIDTFSPIRMDMAILRTLVLGFTLLAILEASTIIGQYRDLSSRESTRSKIPFKWVLTSLALIVGITSLGYLAPKGPPSWPDPVHFIKSYNETAGAGPGRIQKIGYGDQDEILGGSFIQDDSIVFTASSTERVYWRGESKDQYTGRGWKRTEPDYLTLPYYHMQEELRNKDIFHLYDESTIRKNVMAHVQFRTSSLNQIFYPGQIKNFTTYPEGNLSRIDLVGGSFTLWSEPAAPQMIQEYSLESGYPQFSIKQLREITQEEYTQIPQEILEQYTQLPESLPERVGQLAVQVTKNKEKTYDKVKEIELFFKRYGFVYDTQNVPVPAADQDYVDQFLFETKRGYCNNFSTSMVVMLRTLGIPARWVKGFTFGDFEALSSNNMHTVVRNKNAHSWVEVYFPGIGWVPFEPTKSFSNSFQFEYDDYNSTQTNTDDLLAESSPQRDYTDLELDPGQDIPAFAQNNPNKSWYKKYSIPLVILIMVISLLLFSIFFRKKLFLTWIILRYRDKKDPHMFVKAYEWLILYFGRFILPKDPSQTMREYIMSLESKIETDELKPLTRTFEDLRYGNKPGDEKKISVAYDIWESIMRKLRS